MQARPQDALGNARFSASRCDECPLIACLGRNALLTGGGHYAPKNRARDGTVFHRPAANQLSSLGCTARPVCECGHRLGKGLRSTALSSQPGAHFVTSGLQWAAVRLSGMFTGPTMRSRSLSHASDGAFTRVRARPRCENHGVCVLRPWPSSQVGVALTPAAVNAWRRHGQTKNGRPEGRPKLN